MHFLKRTLATAITAALAFVFLPELSQAQAPQAINSQAVARDTSGAPIANKSLNIVVTITDSILFIPVYEETWRRGDHESFWIVHPPNWTRNNHR